MREAIIVFMAVVRCLPVRRFVNSIPHRIKGEGICCFVLLADGAEHTPELEKQLVVNVRSQIGAFATPDVLVIVPDLPKVRSKSPFPNARRML